MLHLCNEKTLYRAEFLENGDSSGAIDAASDIGGWLRVSKGSSASLIRALVKTLEKLAMKKSLIALAALAATASFAQSTATISGTISVGVMDTGAAGTKAAVSSLGGGANAVNIVTVEDLGGGLKGGFDSQIRFNAATGDRNSSGTGNALFHNANVYVGGGFGTVRMGKIAEDSNCGFDPYGCTGGAGVIAGAGGTSGLIAALTQASSVRYESPTFAGFSLRYQTTVTARTNERSVLNLGYANGPLSVQYLQSKNSLNVAADGLTTTSGTFVTESGTPDTTASALTGVSNNGGITDVKGKGTSIGASYNLGFANVAVFNAVTKSDTDVTTKDITGLTASAPMGAFTLLAGYAKDKKAAADADTKYGFGVNYTLSKRTTLGADVFKDEALKNTTGAAGTGFVVRARHTF